jgi:hypothetical protein
LTRALLIKSSFRGDCAKQETPLAYRNLNSYKGEQLKRFFRNDFSFCVAVAHLVMPSAKNATFHPIRTNKKAALLPLRDELGRNKYKTLSICSGTI